MPGRDSPSPNAACDKPARLTVPESPPSNHHANIDERTEAEPSPQSPAPAPAPALVPTKQKRKRRKRLEHKGQQPTRRSARAI
ncbi:hypothetical protein BGAL_0169g00070 [Botrytis galanthina]|uniref:Uncharacterized protein n=1 Tax=Botrytis galanthina TaxID=278940 RepID=A0A4V4HUN3_9HELO|nr:hypothetical protein BGAL_0169g00070 [Botrytis galanthina]